MADANDFSIVLATRGLAKLIGESLSLEQLLLADGTPNQAAVIRRATAELERELEAIGVKVAKAAQQEIRSLEVSTQVRPDTAGGGGPRLGDYIGTSAPLHTVPGSVGINNERELEDNGVEWWWTNEEGYSGHIGRTFIGAFEGTRPTPGEFRTHALLEIGKGVKGSGKGTIRNPIPERRFVRDGAAAAQAQWHAEIQAAKARFMASVTGAMASAARAGAVRARVGP